MRSRSAPNPGSYRNFLRFPFYLSVLFSLWKALLNGLPRNAVNDCAFSALYSVLFFLFETKITTCHNKLQKKNKNKIKTPLKETSFWAQCGAEPHGGHFDWLALRWQGACGRTRLALLKDDSTMQRKEWALHSKSSVIGEHQSVCMSTKSTAVPTLFPAALTHEGFPVHICGTFVMSALPSAVLSSPIYGQQAGWRAPSSGHGWLKQQWDKAAI